jgi:hypothetical protein
MTWKELAAKALVESYHPGHWQWMRERHLRKFFPELVEELEQKGELQDFLVATTYAVHEMCEVMEDRGTAPQIVGNSLWRSSSRGRRTRRTSRSRGKWRLPWLRSVLPPSDSLPQGATERPNDERARKKEAQ